MENKDQSDNGRKGPTPFSVDDNLGLTIRTAAEQAAAAAAAAAVRGPTPAAVPMAASATATVSKKESNLKFLLEKLSREESKDLVQWVGQGFRFQINPDRKEEVIITQNNPIKNIETVACGSSSKLM